MSVLPEHVFHLCFQQAFTVLNAGTCVTGPGLTLMDIDM